MVRTNDFLKSINLYVKVAQSQKVFHFVFNENQKKKWQINTILELYQPKDQLISKCLFGVLNSPKKQTKTIRLEVP